MLRYESNAYVINHVNLLISRKAGRIKIVLNKKTYRMVKALYKIGCISNFIVVKQVVRGSTRKYLVLSSLFYRNTSFFKNVRLVSTSSKKHNISLKALKILNQSVKASTLILSTSKGLIDHHEAISSGIGGLVVAIIS